MKRAAWPFALCSLSRMALTGVIVTICVLLAAAQDRLPPELSVGWAPVFDSNINVHVLPGWYASVSGAVNRSISVVFDASGWYEGYTAYGDRHYLSTHSFTGGPRVVIAGTRRTRPFAQMLVGTSLLADGAGHHLWSQPTLQPGGGIDISLTGHRGVAARAQVDYLRERNQGDYGNYYWGGYWRVVLGMTFRPKW